MSPGVPGVPVVPSEAVLKKPRAKNPPPKLRPEPAKPPTPAAELPTQALPVSEPPPRLVETPADRATSLSTPYGSVADSDAPGAPVEVSKKSRGPLIGALVAVVLAVAAGGYVLSQGGGDEAAADGTTTTVGQSTTASTIDDEGEGVVDDSTSTTTEGDTTTSDTASDVTVPDSDLKESIESVLVASVLNLEVGVTEGTATLNGSVDTIEDRNSAVEITEVIPGVRLVISNLRVHSADEICSDLIQSQPRWACITDAWFEDGLIQATFVSENDGTPFSVGGGFHLHVFGSNVDPINAGLAGPESIGGGKWLVWDEVPDFSATPGEVLGTAEMPEKLCVRIATSGHTLESLDSGNCFPIRIIGG